MRAVHFYGREAQERARVYLKPGANESHRGSSGSTQRSPLNRTLLSYCGDGCDGAGHGLSDPRVDSRHPPDAVATVPGPLRLNTGRPALHHPDRIRMDHFSLASLSDSKEERLRFADRDEGWPPSVLHALDDRQGCEGHS